MHSPFVYYLNDIVLPDIYFYQDFDKIESLRSTLLENTTEIEVTDLGAGSKKNNELKRSIQTITKNTSKPARIGRLLFKLVDFFQPQCIIELGTSMGISTAYLASAKKKASLYTLEGSDRILAQAQSNLFSLGLDHVYFIKGDFDTELPKILEKIEKVDFVFIDGNHRYDPTIRYFQWLLEKVTEDSVLIFDDIHWSSEMQKAWLEIIAHPKVKISIDLYDVGIVLFRTSQPKEHFVLKYDRQF